MRRLRSFPASTAASFRQVMYLLLTVLIFQGAAEAQESCLAPGRVDEIKKQLAGTPPTEDLQLSSEFVALGGELIAAGKKMNAAVGNEPDEKYNELIARARTRVCEYLNKSGWPAEAAVKREGVNAFMYMVSKTLPVRTQLEIYPVVAEAVRRNLLERNEYLASYIDRLQIALGRRQLFGSQAFVRDGFLVLAPIERPDRVDERRKEFKMEPLKSYEQFLEASYRMPLIRSVAEPDVPDKAAAAPPPSSTPANTAISLAADGSVDPVIKVSTALVTLDVVVTMPPDSQAAPLQRSDFKAFENGKPVEIESFSRADSPFDIVLLLDMSGSTEHKAGLIRKSTRRFIEMKRPVDRVAVVSFSDTQTVLSELESDKVKLIERVKDIDAGGGSLVWDSIKFAQAMLDRSGEQGRRKAIVVMTDGADNSLNFELRVGSKISFADLVESVQHGNAAIFPIFLDTADANSGFVSRRMFEDGRRTMAYLADQSAGKMYTAKKLEDLSQIYGRVLSDVGTVYTLGFSPSGEITDGKWRSIRVDVPSRPGIKLHHRPGYFPRPAATPSANTIK